jgi:hypothetical protein
MPLPCLTSPSSYAVAQATLASSLSLKVAAPVSKTNATAVGFAVNGSACHQ